MVFPNAAGSIAGQAGASSLGSAGSSFLTSGAAGLGLAAGLGSFAGGLGQGNGYNRWKRSLRKQYEYQQRYMPGVIKANVQGYRDAGLHPLAALGASIPSSPGGAVIPGQSTNLGSAVDQGISTYLNAKQARESQQHARAQATLGLEEQKLRNDWVRQQIAHSKLKMLGQVANATGRGRGTPGPGPSQPGELTLSKNVSLPTGTTTSSQAAEDRYWEIGGAGQGLLNLGYDSASWLLPTQDDWNKLYNALGMTGSGLAPRMDSEQASKFHYRLLKEKKRKDRKLKTRKQHRQSLPNM